MEENTQANKYAIDSDIKLKPAHKKFVIRYINNGYVAHDAALYAGYSPKSAHSQGSRLLKDEKIKQVIEAHFQELANDNRKKKEAIVADLLEIVNLDVTDFFNISEDGKMSLKPTNQVEKSKRKWINEIQLLPSGNIKVKLFSKETALEMLNKIEGNYEKDKAPANTASVVLYKLPDNGRGAEGEKK